MKKSARITLISSLILTILSLFLFIYANQYNSIPILLYHHVNYIDKDSLSVTPEIFEAQMKYLYDNNYNSLFLDDVLNIIKKKKRFLSKSVVVTFDDGYLDNWVYAYPILKKYKIKATIFVITSYIKNRNKYRPNLEDVWKGRDKKQALPEFPDHNTVNFLAFKYPLDTIKYFLTWEEMEQMIDSGLIDIQSHTHTHASYFINNNIIDFNHENEWKIASSTGGDIRTGIPIYSQASAMIARRFFDDKGLRNFIAEYVKNNGGRKFFDKNPENYKEILKEQVIEYKKKYKLNEYYEDQYKQTERIRRELIISRTLLEKNLGIKSHFIAWPFGKYNNLNINIAKSAGYKGALTTLKGANKNEKDIWSLKRIKVWPRGNWWFAIRLFAYSNAPLADICSLFTK
ncbi:MAG: polysaccharide deacetylase family protein [Candidatus Firestonebacteria bacterium]|nr:polysaccharide deacetylase family protein [Candidatus Firestonebacteria bacterium]